MAHKKKLVYLLHDIALGGAEIAFLSALPALHRAFRLRVYVLQRMDEALLGSLPPELRACIIHYPLPASRLPFRLPGLLRQIRLFRPDMLVSSLWRASLAASVYKKIFPGVRYTALMHNTTYFHRADRFGSRLALRTADSVLADAEATSAFISGQYPALKAQVLSFLTDPSPEQEPIYTYGEQKNLVFVGRIHPVKQVPLLVDAIARLRERGVDARLDIYGRDDGALEAVEQRVRGHQLQPYVQLKGELHPRDRTTVLAQYPYYIQVSHREGMAMSVAEAMQQGKVCFVQPAGEIARYARDGESAVFLRTDTADQWGYSLERMAAALTDAAQCRQISRAAYQVFRQRPVFARSLLQALGAGGPAGKPKLCFVSNTAWSFVRFRMDLFRALKDAYEVILVAPPDDQVPRLEAAGLRFIPLHQLAAKGMNPLQELRLYRELRSIYRQERPAIIFHYTPKPNIYGSMAAAAARIPAVAVITGLGYTFLNGWLLRQVASVLYRLALRGAQQVWFLNRADRGLFLQRRLVRAGKTGLLPGEGVNTHETYRPERVTPALPPDGTVRFLLIGRLLNDKGVREFVEAARQLRATHPEARFLLLGYLHIQNPSAVPKDQLDDWVAKGWVEYLGSTDDVRPYIASADCVVLPSYREGMSTTLQESAAMARPLIASDIPGCRELISDGVTGFLCKPRDAAGLAQQMARFLRLSKAEQQQMGIAGRQKMIDEFSVQQVVTVYREYIRQTGTITENEPPTPTPTLSE